MDRQAMTQALAKALAYAALGKPREADQWARELVKMLAQAGIILRADIRC